MRSLNCELADLAIYYIQLHFLILHSDVSSLHTEELYLSIWDDNFKVDNEMQNLTKENKHGGLRGFFKPRRNHVDGKISGGLIGHCKLPVRVSSLWCVFWVISDNYRVFLPVVATIGSSFSWIKSARSKALDKSV